MNNTRKRTNINETPKSILRRVTIMTTGTRGDIQPFVAIGIALKRKGYTVRILTHSSPTHTKLCKDFGLEHVAFGGDSEAFMRENKEARTAMETGDTIKFFGCLADLMKNNTESTCEPFCDEVIKTEYRPDLLVVSYLNRFFGLYAKHVLKIPTIEIKLQHWVFDDPSRAPMGMPSMPLGLHKLIHTKLMIPQDYSGFQRFDDCIAAITASNNTASKELLLPRIEDFLLYEQWYNSEVNHSPLLPLLVTQPTIFRDILCPTLPATTSPNTLRYVGPAIIETNDQIDTPSFGGSSREKLQDFLLACGEQKPIYIGWGSMIRKSTHEMVLYAVEVLQKSHQRGIVLGGLAELNTEALEEAVKSIVDEKERQQILNYAKENVLFIDKAPHEWLFPKVALTVHHGGAGTLNASLRAGVPTIVTPVFGDQYDNSFVVQKLGVGFGFEKKLQTIGSNSLSKTITTVLKDPAITERAEKLGKQLCNSSNNDDIVREIDTYWEETVASGNFLNEIQDWQIITKKARENEKYTRLRNRVMVAFAAFVAIISILVK